MEKRKKVIFNDSVNIKVEGHTGTWYVISSAQYPQGILYLLEHEKYGDEAPSVIVNQFGDLILEDVYNGFSDYDEIHDQF